MRTEDTLRAAFALMEEQAPTEVTLPTRGPAPRGRAIYAMAAAVAAVVAVAVAVPVLAHRSDDRVPPGASVAPAGCGSMTDPASLRYGVGFAHLAGLTIQDRWLCATSRGGRLAYPWHGNGLTEINPTFDVYQRGVFDPSEVAHGQSVTVNGHRGYYGTMADPSFGPGVVDLGSTSPSSASPSPASPGATATNTRTWAAPKESMPLPSALGVAWEYKPGSWAVLRLSVPGPDEKINKAAARAALLRIANAVRTDTDDALPVPFRLGYLPARLKPKSATDDLYQPTDSASTSDAGGESGGSIDFTVPGLERCSPQPLCTTALVVNAYGNFGSKPEGHAFLINGNQAYFIKQPFTGETILTVLYPHWTLQLTVRASNPAHITRAEMTKIAKNATVIGTSASSANWFAANAAVPS